MQILANGKNENENAPIEIEIAFRLNCQMSSKKIY